MAQQVCMCHVVQQTSSTALPTPTSCTQQPSTAAPAMRPATLLNCVTLSTACAGANDVANAIGSFCAAFYVYQNMAVSCCSTLRDALQTELSVTCFC
jgi:phosphate/sulfate permease